MSLDYFSWICFNDYVDVPSHEKVESMIDDYSQKIVSMQKNIELSKNRLSEFKEILGRLKQDIF